MLSKQSQTEKDKCLMFSPICGSRCLKNDTSIKWEDYLGVRNSRKGRVKKEAEGDEHDQTASYEYTNTE
jgi:hypothetical protein